MKPGFCEIDTVSHDGGGDLKDHYAWTLTVTDVYLCRKAFMPRFVEQKNGIGYLYPHGALEPV
jgi:hypothetical protein